jgi:hypothetical protein
LSGRSVRLAFFLGGVMLAVSPMARSSPDEQARRSVAVSTLRAINSAEYAYKFRHGTFASWNVLLASGEFTGRGMHLAVQNEPQLVNEQF